jgi:hypothetical protein
MDYYYYSFLNRNDVLLNIEIFVRFFFDNLVQFRINIDFFVISEFSCRFCRSNSTSRFLCVKIFCGI